MSQITQSREPRFSKRCTWRREDEFWERTREEPEREDIGETPDEKREETEERSQPRGELKKLED